MSATTAKIESFVQSGDEGTVPLDAGLLAQASTFLGRGVYAADARWLAVLRDGLGHTPYRIVAKCDGQVVGALPLASLDTWLFGKFLVSLPYVNTGGIVAGNDEVAAALVDRAVQLADELDVRHLELRQERAITHPKFGEQLTSKHHMRLALPNSADELWKSFKPKVRNQIRKGEEHALTIHWGSEELLGEFYGIFAQNMRDLGTPVFGRSLFLSILRQFGPDADVCIVRQDKVAIAAAILVHDTTSTQVPSASSLRSANATNANMLMYWHLLQRAITRGSTMFDFGRSSEDSGTYRFKKQWGAEPEPAVWQFYVRKGDRSSMRPDDPRNERRIRVWKKLPVWLTKLAGPRIVRGIP